jgi:hypothetical protein
VARTQQFIQTFDEFLDEVWEMSYGIDLEKLAARMTMRGSFAIKKGNKKKYVNENRTFFCSELVAKAYKVLNVFQTNRSAATFFPNNFAIY